jgi:hypothetical protein
VFTLKKYFPGIARRWEPEGTIFLVRKAEKGDSFVGYGVLKEFVNREKLLEERRKECEKMGWRGVLVFSELFRFEPPLPIKETVLKDSRAKGKCFHGYPLSKEQVDSILKSAKGKVEILKAG